MTSPIAIIGGTGALGTGLARRWHAAGVTVTIGSRDAERARAAAAALGLDGGANGVVAAGADVVVLTVPFRSQSETLTNLRPHLRAGQLLIDCTVPLAAAVSGRATRMLGVWQGSAAQQAAEMTPAGVRVVSALHTVSATRLKTLDHALAEDVLVCGDVEDDKREASALIERIAGLRCVDCGPLENSRTTEALTALLIDVNRRYRAHAGIQITGLP